MQLQIVLRPSETHRHSCWRTDLCRANTTNPSDQNRSQSNRIHVLSSWRPTNLWILLNSIDSAVTGIVIQKTERIKLHHVPCNYTIAHRGNLVTFASTINLLVMGLVITILRTRIMTNTRAIGGACSWNENRCHVGMQINTTGNSIIETALTSKETNHRSLLTEVPDVVTRERMRLSSSDGSVLGQTPIVKTRQHLKFSAHIVHHLHY